MLRFWEHEDVETVVDLIELTLRQGQAAE
ncbi:hypothetical protein [Nesterenkonia sedimenti]|nr:hypothetical protein [Nesterenkonia sedimenti]